MTKPRFASLAFTDGAAKGNPGPGGWGAVLLLMPEGRVVELGGGEGRTTNNRMELVAAIAACERLHEVDGGATIHTDSTYVLRGITQWIHAWRRRGWKTASGGEVLNRDLWERLYTQTAGGALSWNHVRGHRGIPGNERADAIATAFAAGKRPELYDGPLVGYPIDLVSLEAGAAGEGVKRKGTRAPAGASKRSGSRRGKPHSYLSVVDGAVERHATWPECERRVKGRRARFKKAMSAADERAILADWGFSPSDVRS